MVSQVINDSINSPRIFVASQSDSRMMVDLNQYSIHRLGRRGLFRGGRMTTLLGDFRRLTLPRRRSAHQSDRSDNDQSSEHEASCKDLSGDSPAKNQRYKRVNV